MLVGCPERRGGMPGSFSTVIANMEPPSPRKQAKRVCLGPERPFLGPWEILGGSRVDRFGTNCPWVESMVNTHFDLVSGPFRA